MSSQMMRMFVVDGVGGATDEGCSVRTWGMMM